ncbi:MAG: hypothetical protein WAN86_15230 [Hyphomicrobiaceae bacterium]
MMTFEHLERVYEGLAKAIDRAGPADEALLLTRLALLLAERLGDIDAVEACIAAALEGEPRDADVGRISEA